jgi:hypothetical protein
LNFKEIAFSAVTSPTRSAAELPISRQSSTHATAAFKSLDGCDILFNRCGRRVEILLTTPGDVDASSQRYELFCGRYADAAITISNESYLSV